VRSWPLRDNSVVSAEKKLLWLFPETANRPRILTPWAEPKSAPSNNKIRSHLILVDFSATEST
jgi:hypothetical protein